MATEMPIPQDFGRFIGPMTDDQSPESDESIFEIVEGEEPEIEELPDGSAIVRDKSLEGPDQDPDFYENMAESMDSWELDKIALKYRSEEHTSELQSH